MINGEFFTVASQCRCCVALSSSSTVQGGRHSTVCTLQVLPTKKGAWGLFRASEGTREAGGRSGTQPLWRYQIYSGLEAVKRAVRTRSASRWRTLAAVYTKSGGPWSFNILSHKIASRSLVVKTSKSLRPIGKYVSHRPNLFNTDCI